MPCLYGRSEHGFQRLSHAMESYQAVFIGAMLTRSCAVFCPGFQKSRVPSEKAH